MTPDTPRNSVPESTSTKSTGARIDHLKWQHRWLTHLGCIEACGRDLGLDASPAWLCGGAGYAFAMRVHHQLCPAGIIAWAPPVQLARHVGYETELLAPGNEEVSRQQQIVWTAANHALDQGMPCIGFAMEAWQSYLINGYDEEGYFYLPVQTGDGHFPKAKMGVEVPCIVTLFRRTNPAPDLTVVKEALTFATRFATDPAIAPGWGGPPEHFTAGLAGYNPWLDSLLSGQAAPHDLAFNCQVYAELRQLAVDFLREAADRLDRRTAFSTAIGRYESVASSLKSLAELFPLPADSAHHRDTERRRTAVAHLRSAKSAEEMGVGDLLTLLREL